MKWPWQRAAQPLPEIADETTGLLSFHAYVRDLADPGEKHTVKLTAGEWCAVLATMSWPLPDIEERDDAELAPLSEACFRAQRKIRRAIGKQRIREDV